MKDRFGIRVVGVLALLVLVAGGFRLAVGPLADGPNPDFLSSTGNDSGSSERLATFPPQAGGVKNSASQQRPITLSSGPVNAQGALAAGDNPQRSDSKASAEAMERRPFWDAPDSTRGDAAGSLGLQKTSEDGGASRERFPGDEADARASDHPDSYGSAGAGQAITSDTFASVMEREGRKGPTSAGLEIPTTGSAGERDSDSLPSYPPADAGDTSPLSSNVPNWLDTNVQTASVEEEAAGEKEEKETVADSSSPTDPLPPWLPQNVDGVAAEPDAESREEPESRVAGDPGYLGNSRREDIATPQGDAPNSAVGEDPFTSPGQQQSMGADQGPARSNLAEVGAQGAAGTQQTSVPAGETYWSVARREFGSEAFHRALQAYNRDYARGEGRIVVPSETSLRQLYPDLCPAVESVVVNAATDWSQHVVASGETIFDVARKELGTAAAWRRIVEANQDQLGRGIELLAPGMRLRIPIARHN